MEDINRKIEFIVEQQAQFAADIQMIRETIKEQHEVNKEQQRDFMNDLTMLANIVGNLASLQEKTNAIVANLAQRQITTEDRLNSLITVVERHVGGHS